MQTVKFLIPFQSLDDIDGPLIGKQGEKLASLFHAGFPLPRGFILTTDAYFDFLQSHKLDNRIKQLLTLVSFDYPETVMQTSNHIKKMFYDESLSPDLIQAVKKAYTALENTSVQLSAHSQTKDAPLHSRQYATYEHELLLKIKDAWAEHFTANLLAKRHEQDNNQIKTGTTIIIEETITPDKKGTLITIDPATHEKNIIHIIHHAPHGNDTYSLSKKNGTILDRNLKKHHIGTERLTYDELIQIADLGRNIEQHLYFPQQVSWGIKDGKLYLFNNIPYIELPKPHTASVKKHAIARGHGITHTIGTGPVKIILSQKDLEKLNPQDIVVTNKIMPSYLPHLLKVQGILAEEGEKHSEISTILRHHGIPTLYDVKFATRALKNGTIITIHAGNGEIYTGGFHK